MKLSFNRNLGRVDRTIRIIAGVIIIYLVFFSPQVMSWLGLVLGVFGGSHDY